MASENSRNQNELTIGCLLSLIGLVLGTVIVSTIYLQLVQYFSDPRFTNGESWEYMGLVFTLPTGGILGAITGYGTATWISHKMRKTSIIFLFGGCGVIIGILGMEALFTSPTPNKEFWIANIVSSEHMRDFVELWALPLLWATILTALGVMLIVKTHRGT